jgi:uncharacterized protein
LSNIAFIWDRRKARANLAKHGLSFEEGETVFLDEDARLIDDPHHSLDEDSCCWVIAVGHDALWSAIVIRSDDSMIRLISVRHATVGEEKMYWSYR